MMNYIVLCLAELELCIMMYLLIRVRIVANKKGENVLYFIFGPFGSRGFFNTMFYAMGGPFRSGNNRETRATGQNTRKRKKKAEHYSVFDAIGDMFNGTYSK